MPQMSPMSWLTLFNYFMMMIFIIPTLIYFIHILFFTPSSTSALFSISSKMNIKKSFKFWKW